jgi:hypothetical protein
MRQVAADDLKNTPRESGLGGVRDVLPDNKMSALLDTPPRLQFK